MKKFKMAILSTLIGTVGMFGALCSQVKDGCTGGLDGTNLFGQCVVDIDLADILDQD